MTNSKKVTRRLWFIYGAFASIVILCLILFFKQVIQSDDSYIVKQWYSQIETGSKPVLEITDLTLKDNDENHAYIVKDSSNGVTVIAQVTRFNALFCAADNKSVSSPLIGWAVALQIFSVLAVVAVVVLTIYLLMIFYRSIRRTGQVFHWRSVRTLRAIAILMFLMTISADVSLVLEREVAYHLLQQTDWIPQLAFTIHFSRLLFALFIFFVAELIHIGHKMQIEQDLTI